MVCGLILYIQIFNFQCIELSFQVIKKQLEGIVNLNRV